MFALPPAHPPAKTVAGVHISWPALPGGALPGMPLTVKVSSSHRRTQLALVRVNAAGKPIRGVVRKTLRTGKLTVTIPPGNDRTYQLRATIAGKRYWSWVTVTHPLASPSVPALSCTPGVAPTGATITLGATSVEPGGSLPYTVTNTSAAGCLTEGAGFALERLQSDGSWQAYPLHIAIPQWVALVQPGQAFVKAATIPPETPGGSYRIVESLSASLVLTSEPFTVPASLSCDIAHSYAIDLRGATVTPGVSFSYHLTGVAVDSDVAKWQRQDGEDWVDYADGAVDVTTRTASLPAAAPAGVYRLQEVVHPKDDACDYPDATVDGPEITLP